MRHFVSYKFNLDTPHETHSCSSMYPLQLRFHFQLFISLLPLGLCATLSAFEQGTYFLFDIKTNGAESGQAGRIAIAASLFQETTEDSKTIMTGQGLKNKFGSNALKLGESAADTTGASSSAFHIKLETLTPEGSEDPNTPPSSNFFFDF